MCNNLCTVLGKNAPNGYTEIHQSILNSYSTVFCFFNEIYLYCMLHDNFDVHNAHLYTFAIYYVYTEIHNSFILYDDY